MREKGRISITESRIVFIFFSSITKLVAFGLEKRKESSGMCPIAAQKELRE